METIFDYNPTSEELNRIGYIKITKDMYLERFNTDTYNIDLAYLMYFRNNRSAMKVYIEKVDDTMRVISFWRTISHPK